MSIVERYKQSVGHDRDNLPTIASAATIYIPDNQNTFVISGSTNVSNILSANSRYATQESVPANVMPGRRIKFIGASGSSFNFADAGTSPTLGQTRTSGTGVAMAVGRVMEFVQHPSGHWIEVAFQDN